MTDLEPMNRTEAILSGEDLTPMTRLEVFLKEAASGGGGTEFVHTGPITDTSINDADGAIYVDGVELTTYQACSDYINNILDKNIIIEGPSPGIYYYPTNVSILSVNNNVAAFSVMDYSVGSPMTVGFVLPTVPDH